MKMAKLAVASFAGVIAGVLLEHNIRDAYNWVRGKLGLPAVPTSGPDAAEEKPTDAPSNDSD